MQQRDGIGTAEQAMAPRSSAAWLCLLLAVAPWAGAAPEDDHRLGVAAYRRGDVVGAMAALRPAARAGHAASQVKLAFILESADFAQEASRLYAAAAEQGSAEGHAGLAALLLAGRGIAKDEKRAAQHFSKAAEAGHLLAAEILAKAYRTGGMGLAIDPVEAARWEQRSAELRSAAAGTGPER